MINLFLFNLTKAEDCIKITMNYSVQQQAPLRINSCNYREYLTKEV